MDLTKLDEHGKRSLKDFYLGICFDSLKTLNEKVSFILENKNILNIKTYDNILESIVITKDKIRQQSTGFYKVESILMSEKVFVDLKKQQKIDESINSISVRGSKVFSSNVITDTKIIFISEPKIKTEGKLTDKITIMESKI